MKLVSFQPAGTRDILPGVLTERGVVSVADAVPLSDVRLRAPLPQSGKILACIANYWEHGALEARPLNMFLKNPDAVIGPEDTIVLPEFTEPCMFVHEAEFAIVIKGPAKLVTQENWRHAVFGYTGMIDVSARGRMRLHVRDPLKRSWEKGVYMGPDSTNPEAVRRNRPLPS